MTVGSTNWYPVGAQQITNTTTTGVIDIPYYDNLMVMWSCIFTPTADVPILLFNRDSLNTPCWWRVLSSTSGSTTLTNTQFLGDLAVRMGGFNGVNSRWSGVTMISNVTNSVGERPMSSRAMIGTVSGGSTLHIGSGARVGVGQPIYSVTLRGNAFNTFATDGARLAVFGSNII